MSKEEKINKMIEDIEIRRNDEQYRGGPFPIYHIEFDILKEEIERLNNIIKEVRKYIDKEHKLLNLDKSGYTYTKIGSDILEILDKGE